MKEATGELNLTVFIIIAGGILAAFFYFTIWPMMRSSQNNVANCNNAICGTDVSDGRVTCYLKKKPTEPFTCPWKG